MIDIRAFPDRLFYPGWINLAGYFTLVGLIWLDFLAGNFTLGGLILPDYLAFYSEWINLAGLFGWGLGW